MGADRGGLWLRRIAPLLCVVVGLSAGCDRGAEPAATPDPPAEAAPDTAPDIVAARKQAKKAVRKLSEALQGELGKALAAGPPERALYVCADSAQAIAAQVAEESGVSVRRTSLKLRNPKNLADAYERGVLEAWASQDAALEPHVEVVSTPDGARQLRYLQPIVLQPLCTRCHGAPGEIPERVVAALAERYPDDKATGFRPGDLRGAVSVRVPLPDPAAESER